MDKKSKVKEVKRKSRQENKIMGKPGAHVNKEDKRRKKKSLNEYLDECEEE